MEETVTHEFNNLIISEKFCSFLGASVCLLLHQLFNPLSNPTFSSLSDNNIHLALWFHRSFGYHCLCRVFQFTPLLKVPHCLRPFLFTMSPTPLRQPTLFPSANINFLPADSFFHPHPSLPESLSACWLKDIANLIRNY